MQPCYAESDSVRQLPDAFFLALLYSRERSVVCLMSHLAGSYGLAKQKRTANH